MSAAIEKARELAPRSALNSLAYGVIALVEVITDVVAVLRPAAPADTDRSDQ